MKKTKDRVIAIDYFRGICILIVLLSHTALFSMPYSYLSGDGQLWVSAAELFFILSGLTFGIIRGQQIKTQFREVFIKTARRAAILYLLNALLIFYAIVVGYYAMSHGLTFYSNSGLPANNGWPLLADVLALRSPLGWADFLMYFSIFLLLAPLIYRALMTRLWSPVFLASLSLFLIADHGFAYANFAIWQLYFIIGLTLARFRLTIIKRLFSLPQAFKRTIYRLATIATAVVIFISSILAFNLFPYVNHAAISGWLPLKASSAYLRLLKHQPEVDTWLRSARTGALRPLIALLFLFTAYIIYQKHKTFLLQRTGRIVNQFGSQTLWIYVAQAVVIPLIALLPLKFGGFAINTLTTAGFMYGMWLVTQKQRIIRAVRTYGNELKLSYTEAKYRYLQQYEES